MMIWDWSSSLKSAALGTPHDKSLLKFKRWYVNEEKSIVPSSFRRTSSRVYMHCAIGAGMKLNRTPQRALTATPWFILFSHDGGRGRWSYSKPELRLF